MDKIVALAKSRGFVYPGSEIYGGLANTWDYGNLGVELKNNVKKAWWKKFVQESPYNVGVDCAILMNPQTWIASGHLGGFSDPLMDCKECNERFRADKLIEDYAQENGIELEGSVDAWSKEQMSAYIEEHDIKCPSCGKHNFTEIREFNLMFKTFQGVTEDAKNVVYLRPETAQGIFVNFKNVQRTSRKKIPFGIAQIGKSFRNEITPGNFTFRTREFEQMELEFFCEPGTDLEWFNYWKSFCLNWLSSLGLKDDEVRYRDHDAEELSFYSKATTDVEFLFPFGWGELWGIADRTDYDLTQHQEVSKQDLTYFDDEKKEKYIPYVIEPSLGADRMVLAFLCSAYDEEELEGGDTRTVLHFHPALAPVKIGVLPLSKKLNEGAEKVFAELSKTYNCEFDDRGMFSRSSYVGMHRYGGIWMGDNKSWWSHILLNLKMLPSLNMCGFLYTGADLGGFGADTTRDLVLRWLALGVFTPLMRNHSALGTREQEAYQFENIEDFRHVIGVRYRLVPYLYSEYMKAALNDDMMFRPLAFDYTDDAFATQVEDQLLLGNEIMIAPVYTQNAKGRYVYLPEEMMFVKFLPDGTISQEILEKGHHYVEVALNEVPLFIRKGKAIPVADVAQTVKDIDPSTIRMIGYEGAEYDRYDDDGVSAL